MLAEVGRPHTDTPRQAPPPSPSGARPRTTPLRTLVVSTPVTAEVLEWGTRPASGTLVPRFQRGKVPGTRHRHTSPFPVQPPSESSPPRTRNRRNPTDPNPRRPETVVHSVVTPLPGTDGTRLPFLFGTPGLRGSGWGRYDVPTGRGRPSGGATVGEGTTPVDS